MNHPNFGLFFDPGNVVYYTGKDPVKQLELIGPYVSGVVAKDCNAPHFMERAAGDPPFGEKVTGAGNPEVMIQFGTGKVDFAGFLQAAEVLRFQRPRHGRGHPGRSDPRRDDRERPRQPGVPGESVYRYVVEVTKGTETTDHLQHGETEQRSNGVERF